MPSMKSYNTDSMTLDIESIFVVIPAKNEDRYILSLIDQIRKEGFKHIVIVNDSSTDQTRELAEQYLDVVVLDHVINLGPGAATQTGIAYAVTQDAEIILTIDADLQHNPKDLKRLMRHMKDHQCDLVIGSRFLQKNNIPASRIFYNKIGNIISFFLTGKMLTDSQSGLKAISGHLAKSMDLNYDGFEFCMEIIKHANFTKAKVSEIPVDVRYTSQTRAKGQSFRSGLDMISRIFSPFN